LPAAEIPATEAVPDKPEDVKGTDSPDPNILS
jgi:hypothetical protein